jgi:hypothetical protein
VVYKAEDTRLHRYVLPEKGAATEATFRAFTGSRFRVGWGKRRKMSAKSRANISRTLGEGQEVEGLGDSPHPVSAISFLISLTHRALPNVLLQKSAGIGCLHFEPFIIPGYTPRSLCVVGIFLKFASIGARHISLHRGLYSS